MTREVESGEAVAGDREGDGCVWHCHAAGRSRMANCINRVTGLERARAQTGCVMRVSAPPGREEGGGAQREGKPVTSPGGPVANDIARRARSQARRVIYGKGWQPGAAAPEPAQMWRG